eukprot:5891782-Prymnesium_polylepis.2
MSPHVDSVRICPPSKGLDVAQRVLGRHTRRVSAERVDPGHPPDGNDVMVGEIHKHGTDDVRVVDRFCDDAADVAIGELPAVEMPRDVTLEARHEAGPAAVALACPFVCDARARAGDVVGDAAVRHVGDVVHAR